MERGTREDVFSTDEGTLVLQWPTRISKASEEDVSQWLDIVKRKINRAADLAEQDSPDSEYHRPHENARERDAG